MVVVVTVVVTTVGFTRRINVPTENHTTNRSHQDLNVLNRQSTVLSGEKAIIYAHKAQPK